MNRSKDSLFCGLFFRKYKCDNLIFKQETSLRNLETTKAIEETGFCKQESGFRYLVFCFRTLEK
jgi:hypothetical protein